MLGTLQPGDRLLVSELSRLGRSLSQVIRIVETRVRRKIRFIAIKEAIEFDGKQDLRTQVMIALFGLFAEVERNLLLPTEPYLNLRAASRNSMTCLICSIVGVHPSFWRKALAMVKLVIGTLPLGSMNESMYRTASTSCLA